MDTASKKYIRLFYIGLGIFLIATIVGIWDYLTPDTKIVRQSELIIQKDFDALKLSLAKNQKEYLEKYFITQLTFGKDGQLQYWSDSPYQPSYDLMRNSYTTFTPQEGLITDNHSTYYYLKVDYKDSTHIYFVPIKAEFEITNPILPKYVFLGSFSGDNVDVSNLEISSEKITEDVPYLTIKDSKGKPFWSILYVSPLELRADTRKWIVIFGAIGLILSLLSVYLFMKSQPSIGEIQAKYLIAEIVFYIRAILLGVGFPQNYYHTDLFSAKTLAFHTLVPSLGDLVLDIFVFYLISWALYRHFYFSLVDKFYETYGKNKWIYWSIFILNVLILSLISHYFVLILDEVIINSKIRIDYSNIFKNDIYSYILLASMGNFFTGMYYLLKFIFKWNLKIFDTLSITNNLNAILLQSLIMLGLFNLVWHHNLIESFSIWLALSFFGISVYRAYDKDIFSFDTFNYLILLAGMTFLVSVNLLQTNEVKRLKEAETIVLRSFRNQPDDIARTILKITFKLQQSDHETVVQKFNELNDNDEFISWVKKKFCNPQFNPSSLNIFMLDSTGSQRLAATSEAKMVTSAEMIPTSGQKIDDEGKVFRIPFFEDYYDGIYVGIDTLTLGPKHKFVLKFEILPSNSDIDRLYPALLQSNTSYYNNLQARAYDFGFYRNNILHSSIGKSEFPLQLQTNGNETRLPKDTLINIKNTTFAQNQNKNFNDYLFRIDSGKMIIMRFAKLGLSDYINNFSFIFFFFGIIILIVNALNYLIKAYIKSEFKFTINSLRAKFQLLFFMMGLVPLLLISFILTSFVRNRLYQQSYETLKSETDRVVNGLHDITLDIQKIKEDSLSANEINDIKVNVTRLGEELSQDINVYGLDGVLIASTQMRILESGISSGYMSTEAYQMLKSEKLGKVVVKEHAGTVEYLSGYASVIRNKKPVLFVNVPYLAKQDEIQEKTFDILGYIINIYLFIIIGMSFLAILISRSLTHPLQLVQDRLKETSLGTENDNRPLSYSSDDEIGGLIKAYNAMVEKLAESQKQLQQNERDNAWKIMARQVAHEIKNPLTPIKVNMELMQRAWNDNHPNLQKISEKVIKSVLGQIDALVRIVDTFSTFGQMHEPKLGIFNLNEVLQGVIVLFENSPNINLQYQLPEETFMLSADKDMLTGVFNNLIKNAIQAMEDGGDLTVTMKIQNEKAYIEIQDTGSGMTDEVKARAFEPNFSTKNSGKGLGLAIVRKSVEVCNGSIRFISQLGVGTTFFLEFEKGAAKDS